MQFQGFEPYLNGNWLMIVWNCLSVIVMRHFLQKWKLLWDIFFKSFPTMWNFLQWWSRFFRRALGLKISISWLPSKLKQPTESTLIIIRHFINSSLIIEIMKMYDKRQIAYIGKKKRAHGPLINTWEQFVLRIKTWAIIHVPDSSCNTAWYFLCH